MAGQYSRWPSTGGGSGVTSYANQASLPATASDGTAAITLDTDTLWIYNAGSTSWLKVGGPTVPLAIGTIDSQTASSNGAVLASNSLNLQSASSSKPGLVNNTSQTFSGSKTFSSVINADAGLDRSTTGTLSIGTTNASTINIGNSGATVNIQGTTLYENVTQLQVTDPLITLNKGGGVGSAANSGIELEENSVITGYVETSADRNSWTLKAPNTAGIATITPGASGITLAGNVSGTNTGDLTLAAVGSTPSANAASLSGQVLTLQPADATHPGVVSTTTQTFAGNKTFSGSISASNLSGTNTGDQTITLTGDVTGSGTGSFAATISANAVTNAKLATMASNTIKGNNSGVSATPTDLTGSQVLTLIGTIPISSGGTGQTTAPAAINALTMVNTNSVIFGTGVSSSGTQAHDVIIGFNAGNANVTSDNVFIGYQAGFKAGTTSGGQNVFIGSASGPQNSNLTTGSHNSAVGYSALGNLQVGASDNSSLGYGAIGNVSTGSGNTGVGSLAGSTILTGSNNTLIGKSADVTTSALSNATAIGYNTTVSASNAMVLGNGANVGIDSSTITAPTARLHLPAGTATAGSAPLKITAGVNLTAAESGAIENDGSFLYYTNSTPTRNKLFDLGQTLATTNGGTGLTSYTTGDTLYASATNTLSKLPIGANNQTKIIQNGIPAWASVSPGPINYILTNYNAEVDTSGWATYSNTAANIPSTGTGGTATGLTFSRSTTSPLLGTASFSMVQTNSTNIQGKGVSYDFTIDSAYQASVLAVNFNYNASSTFVTGDGVTAPLNDGTTSTNSGNSDIEVFVYDKTNSQLIYVTPQVITGKGSNNFQFKGTFQTNSNSTSYRIIFHVATANANATGWTFKFDNVFVGPQAVSYGPPVEDWNTNRTITPSAGFGTVTLKDVRSRIVGDTCQFQGYFKTGTTAGTTISFALPLTIDSSKLTSTASVQILGYCQQVRTGASGASDLVFPIFYDGSDTSNVYIAINSTSNTLTKAVGTDIFNSGDGCTFRFEIPVAGKSSTVQMSNDTDTRIVAASYYVSNGATPNTSATQSLNYDTKVYDTHGAVTASASGTGTWKFTAPVSGFYRINATMNSGAGYVSIYKNGSLAAPLFYNTGTGIGSGALDIQLNAGDYIDLRNGNSVTVSGTGYASGTGSVITISRMSGPSAIAASERIAASYYASSATFTPGSATQFNFDTKLYDTHGAVTTGTGAWKFTAPRSGFYRVSFNTLNNTAAATDCALYKNGSSFIPMGGMTTSGIYHSASTELYLNASDFVDIRAANGNQFQGGTGPYNTIVSISSL